MQFKTIAVNGKEVKIPKMSLYHYKVLAGKTKPDEVNFELVKSICPGLSRAERDVVLLHTLEYNGKLLAERNGFKLDNIEICQQLKFHIGDYSFRFTTPSTEDLFAVPEEVLNISIRESRYKGELIENPDFFNMPAYVKNWLELILTTVKMTSDDGEVISGLDEILEYLDVEL